MRDILLVEDNPDDADLARAVLQPLLGEARIDVAEDGVAALDALRGRVGDGLPALVLLDLKLPRMGGLEVLSAIRADPALRHLCVVVLTSSLEEHDLVESYERGANSYVRKPVDFERFARVARQLVDYWLDVNEPSPRVRRARR